MKLLEKALNNIDGYLLSIERDAMKGKYELKVGIPKDWVYESTEKVECEVIQTTKQGDLIKIVALEDDIVIDDLIEFVNIIIATNHQIAEMQEKHKKGQEEAVKKMEEEEAMFMEEIENMAKNSFKNMKEEQDKIGSTEKEDLKKEVEEKLST
jgi:hypothetical protein